MQAETSNGHPTPSGKTHLLCVMLEDYFHAGNFSRVVQRAQWYRFQTRFERNTLKTLDLLDRFGVKATFFSLGWIAEQQPELVREVVRRGHEVASRGLYRRRRDRPMTAAEFRDDLRRTRDSLEAACGVRVVGHRAAQRWTSPTDLWALDVLAEENFLYDTSVLPTRQSARREPWRRFAYRHEWGDKRLWEFPVSTFDLGGWPVPIAGGNFFRQIPHTLLKRAVEHWHHSHDAPFVMYFHVWELDPEQPEISAVSPLARLRHYRKLDKIEWVLEDYFGRYDFTGVRRYLERQNHDVTLAPTYAALPAARVSASSPSFAFATSVVSVASAPSLSFARADEALATETHGIRDDAPEIERAPVCVVVPCFNEEKALPYLSNTLRSVERALERDYRLRFIFVDDCSTDGTWDALHEVFGAWPSCSFLRHAENRGVACAIRTGVAHADAEIVCSLDCDCTYDPHELRHMIPLLTEGVDMVTASPYHPRGRVRNVPRWRLTLSHASSFLYRQVLRQKLYTYTSCFRVYRRSAIVDLDLGEGGFLGVAEMLGRLDLRGGRVVEHPATLEVRLFGHSKMKVLRTVVGHLILLARLLASRHRQSRGRRLFPSARTTSEGHLSLELVKPGSTSPAAPRTERT